MKTDDQILREILTGTNELPNMIWQQVRITF
jgi:hypothetical protein